MPQIGRPQQDNPFGKIQMAPKKSKGSVGDKLNELTGAKTTGGRQFVDAKEHNKLGKDGFLKLLTHQLSNQDPMKPMDQKQFAADLAQFSQLEQLSNMNKKLEKMGGNAPTENKFYAASFLGKEVVTKGSTLKYPGDGSKLNVPFYLPKEATNVLVRLFDSKNQLISQMTRKSMGKGNQAVEWDGKSLDGTVAVNDNYRVEVRAYDNLMSEFKGETKAAGVVTDVHFEGEDTVLVVDGRKKVFLRDVQSFKLPERGAKEGMLKNSALQKKATNAYNNIEEQSL